MLMALVISVASVDAFAGLTYAGNDCNANGVGFSTGGSFHKIDGNGAGRVILSDIDGYIYTSSDCVTGKRHVGQHDCAGHPNNARIYCVTEATQKDKGPGKGERRGIA